ncbi:MULTISPECIES: hypothetical protein [Vibrio]|uniref:hypothetical protein n=1 Tax=Vibrio TaxID=662 RepID=UPI0010816664|nr:MULTISPECIES: hypothetical protein [Vibrio]MCF7502516.1 hypothetical protein [Vibrio sp. L3-7]TVU78978.1 hypothetical protein FQP87_00745 [Vibrio tasmaniensis]
MRLIGLLILLAIAAASFLLEQNSLAGTRWHCKTLKTDFLSQAFQPYQSLYERMSITFQSDQTFSMREFVTIIEKDGNEGTMENLYSGYYGLDGNHLSMSIIDMRTATPFHDPIINQEYSEYKGVTIDYSILAKDQSLYLFNEHRSEIFNWACFKVQK